MASPTNPNEEELHEALEDLELHRIIYEDLMLTRSDDTLAIMETRDTIRRLETKVKHLLGEATPSSPGQDDTSDISTSLPSSTPRPSQPTSSTPRPVDPMSASYWPSSAPSPFSTSSHQHRDMNMPSDPAKAAAEASRKRARHDSTSSPFQPEPSRRALMSNSVSRMANIEAKLERRLEESRKLYAEMAHPDSIRLTASLEGISEEEAREVMAQEQEEAERDIRTTYQLEKDEEYARMLQAQDEPVELERDMPSRSSSNLPVQVNRAPHPPPSIPPISPSRTSLTSHNITPFKFLSLNSPNPSHNSFAQSRSFLLPEDDDLQEITADCFHSQSGYQFIGNRPQSTDVKPPSWSGGPITGPPPMFPGLIPGSFPGPSNGFPRRQLPWMQDTKEDQNALDLVREQEDLEIDEIDFEYVSSNFSLMTLRLTNKQYS